MVPNRHHRAPRLRHCTAGRRNGVACRRAASLAIGACKLAVQPDGHDPCSGRRTGDGLRPLSPPADQRTTIRGGIKPPVTGQRLFRFRRAWAHRDPGGIEQLGDGHVTFGDTVDGRQIGDHGDSSLENTVHPARVRPVAKPVSDSCQSQISSPDVAYVGPARVRAVSNASRPSRHGTCWCRAPRAVASTQSPPGGTRQAASHRPRPSPNAPAGPPAPSPWRSEPRQTRRGPAGPDVPDSHAPDFMPGLAGGVATVLWAQGDGEVDGCRRTNHGSRALRGRSGNRACP